jgi:hypothetical protein
MHAFYRSMLASLLLPACLLITAYQVRFKTHLRTLIVSAAVTTLGVLWQWWSSTATSSVAAAAGAASPAPLLWELVLQLCIGCLAPTMLLYFWEVDERAAFVGCPAPGSRRCSVDDPAGYGDMCGTSMLGKAKEL